MPTVRIRVGAKFGFLTVTRTIPRSKCECLCECGTTKIYWNVNILRREGTKSCGCLQKRMLHKRANPDAPLENLIASYIRTAERRGISFHLSKEQFRLLVTANCFYCRKPPNRTWHRWKRTLQYNGIDRKYGNKNYTKENCVTCCTECNYKKNQMNFDVFMQLLGKTGNINANV
jgi:5-methylcytosine-specific restriction endonuclease McrA